MATTVTPEQPGNTERQLSLVDALVRLAHLVDHVFADVSRDYSLTPQQTQLLCTLTPGPVGMTELSQVLHLERSSLTGLVDRVEKRGLVARSRHNTDRRACLITLTSEGTRAAEAAHAEICVRLEALTGELSETAEADLTGTIAHVIEQYGALRPGTPRST